MGLASRCQRSLFRLASPRQHTLVKLLLIVLLVTIWLLQFNKLQSTSVGVLVAADPKPIAEKLSASNEVIKFKRDFKTIFSPSIQPTKQSMNVSIIERSKYEIRVATTDFPVEQEKSRIRISKNGVLSPRAIRIRPAKPVIQEGNSLLLTCAVIGPPRSLYSNDAPYLNFELPEMPYSLENEVQITYISRMTVLKISEVKKGHEGVYKCVSQNLHNQIKYNTVEVKVHETEKEPEGVNMDNTKSMRKHPTYLDKDPQWNKDELSALLERGTMQEKIVDQFCKRHNLSNQAHLLPKADNVDTECLYRHLLINDKTGTLFCFVPKAGCTNLKLLFFVAQGLIPRTQLQASRDNVNQELLEGVQFGHSFLSRSNTQRNVSLRNYYKFMMYRNPLERLHSGYRSKVERFPLIGLEDDQPHYNWLRKAVYASTHPAKYEDFVLNDGVSAVNISFSDFIDYWLTEPENLKIDEHFRSIFSICQPCIIRFNFYGNFKDFDTDSQVLIKKIHSTPNFLRSGYHSKESSTGTLTQSYYKQLSRAQKINIVRLLKLDLEFYYHLFPSEEEANKTILDV